MRHPEVMDDPHVKDCLRKLEQLNSLVMGRRYSNEQMARELIHEEVDHYDHLSPEERTSFNQTAEALVEAVVWALEDVVESYFGAHPEFLDKLAREELASYFRGGRRRND